MLTVKIFPVKNKPDTIFTGYGAEYLAICSQYQFQKILEKNSRISISNEALVWQRFLSQGKIN